MSAPKRVAIYARVSTEDQAREGSGLGVQEADCQRWAETAGHSVVGVWRDEGISGTKGLQHRPGLAAILDLARAGAVDVVAIHKWDRLARLTGLSSDLRDIFREAGAPIFAVTEPFDDSAAGEFGTDVMAAAASMYRRQMLERTTAGLRRVAEDGYWPGGPAPLGFKIVPVSGTRHSKLAIHEPEAEMIRKAVSLIVDDGCSTWETARLLNGMGMTPRVASRWTHNNLRRVLLSDRIAGTWHYGRSNRWEGQSRDGEVPVIIPEIISPERHLALRAALDASSSGPRRTEDDGFYLVSKGILRGTCGATYHGVYRKDRDKRQYRCANSRPEAERRCDDIRLSADDVEAVVWEAVVDLLGKPDRLMMLAQDFLGLRSEQAEVEGEQVERLEAKVASLERARTEKAVDALKAGLDPELIKSAVSEIEDELAGLRQRLAQLRAWQDDADADSDRMRRLEQLAAMANERLLVMPQTQKRAVLDLLQVRVVVQGWGQCIECQGKGKVRGGTGGLPCPVCRATRHVPYLKITGTFFDRLLEELDVGERADEGLRPSTWCRR